MSKISVIIPVFNTAPHLERCIKSILGQTYKDLQIILIDDGSTDESAAICDQYAKEHKQIIVLHTHNMGVSSARNFGMDAATGEYISFVDSDDALKSDTYTQVINTIKQYGEIDVISFNTIYRDLGDNNVKESKDNLDSGAFLDSNNEIIKAFYNNLLGGISACSKVFKATVVGSLRFDTTVKTNEDKLFVYNVLKKCQTYAHINACNYIYYIRPGSASNSGYSESLLGMELVADHVYKDALKNYPAYKDYAEKQKLLSYILLYGYMTKYKNRDRDFLVKYDALREKITRTDATGINDISNKIQYYIIKYLPVLYNISVQAYVKIKQLLRNWRNRHRINQRKSNEVLILTHALGMNIGGILQAYALQKALLGLGYRPITHSKNDSTISIRDIAGYVKNALSKYLFGRKVVLCSGHKIKRIITLKTSIFIRDHIKTEDLHIGKMGLNKSRIRSFYAIIVGSDQVWRKKYSKVPEFLLDFTKGMDLKRISYAASFGRDDLLEYSEKLINRSADLAKKFDAVSAREDTGVDICNDYWGVNAVRVADPTLLLDADHYRELISSDQSALRETSGDLFTYILDNSNEKKLIVDQASRHLNLDAYSIMPPVPMSKEQLHISPGDYALPSVTQWLKSFNEAKFVITDSYHGCIFSIIFNKPFLAIGNSERGLSRFISLLKVFKLEDRLITNGDDILRIIDSKIDWSRVNKIKANEQIRSSKFLADSLGLYNE